MSVLIRGMEMPEKCGKCRFATAFECQVTKNFITTFNVRQVDCPIAPVPPHGRLIAEDDVIETAWMILSGLGYHKDENPELDRAVRDVFSTAPAIEVE